MHATDNNEIFSRNFARYLDRSGKTQREVAALVDVAPSTVHAWLQGTRYPRIDKIEALAALFGVQKSDLIEDPAARPDPLAGIPNLLPLQLRRFPLLGEIACGEPVLADEHIEIYIAAGADLQADFCLRAKGDSMIGARILDGDIVFVRKQVCYYGKESNRLYQITDSSWKGNSSSTGWSCTWTARCKYRTVYKRI